jgi:phosphatidylglycerol:prolipoprotein diacylglycerol transferase
MPALVVMYPRISDLINDFFGTAINLPVQTYGFFVAIAFILGAIVIYFELGRKENEGIIAAHEKIRNQGKPGEVRELIHPKQLTGNIILVAAVSGIIGSKLFDVIEHLDLLIKDPLHTLFSLSGLAFYGGLITAAFVLSIYVEKNHIPWPVNADKVAPALMLAYGVGRIGCQLAGDGCWGMVNTEPKPEWLAFLPDWLWAFKYPHNIVNQGGLIPGCVGRNCHILNQPVFPTPIYETILALIFFGTLWFLRKRIKLHGILFSVYLILNGTERLIIEQIRVNIRYDFLGMEVTQASVIAVLLIMTGIGLIFYFKWYNKQRKWILKK